jgi:hypothetical protein
MTNLQRGATPQRQSLEALLLARQQFEGNPEGALDEIEHRVRNMLSSEGLRYIGTFLGFKVYEDPTLKADEIRVQNDGQITNKMLDLEKRLSVRSETAATKHDLYKDGDAGLPEAILDRNGQVVLGLCKRCRRGEADLVEPCVISTIADKMKDWSRP